MREAAIDTSDPDAVCLQRYLLFVAGNEPLVKDVECALARRIRGGDREAFDNLIDANLRYVVRFARKFRDRGLSDLDLIAEGTLGLIIAVKHWDEAQEPRFIALASRWIHQFIQAAIAEQDRADVIVLPRRSEGTQGLVVEGGDELVGPSGASHPRSY